MIIGYAENQPFFCPICRVSFYPERGEGFVEECDCGREVCSKCMHVCIECGQRFCEKCLVWNSDYSEWFCRPEESDCMKDYISRQERKENEHADSEGI